MSLGTPDQVLAYHVECERVAAAKQAGPATEDHRTHDSELLASHPGQPGIGQQSATHGAALPAADHGYLNDAVKYG